MLGCIEANHMFYPQIVDGGKSAYGNHYYNEH